MRKFRVKVTLSEKAIEEAKALLKDPKDPTKVTSFIEKYGHFVCSGIFSAGGWFQTIATAGSSEKLEFAVLAREARRKLEGNVNLVLLVTPSV